MLRIFKDGTQRNRIQAGPPVRVLMSVSGTGWLKHFPYTNIYTYDSEAGHFPNCKSPLTEMLLRSVGVGCKFNTQTAGPIA